ncbi:outer membrane protein transport protein [Vibrio hangzhouensis]|uniref:Long-chain fatty acid transport protein n=1 Tax=Vibrio hangzhouensis TaxID=462991 RepID=A0A1H5ZCX1_9VIBR|nr:outer membrane protein transport protein [Vibrio hangzhouensis]SEG34152.1 long-chain fatty acid transport protein [Vibrio hangzhouensis]
MTTSRLYKKTLLAVAISSLTFASHQAAAAGFQLNSQSATGLGRAFAGDAVIADNASVMARNAAAMTLFDSHQFSGGVNVIASSIDVKDIGGAGAPPYGLQEPNANNTATSYVPNIYYVHRLNDKWALGAGLYSNFGTTNNFSDSFGNNNLAKVYGGTTEITSVNLTLNAAYRINEQWSVGGGIDIIQGTGRLKRETSPATPSVPLPPGLPVSDSDPIGQQAIVDIDATGYGLGFNLGAVFELNQNNRFGLAYHYSPAVDADGTVNFGPNITAGGGTVPVASQQSYDSVTLPLPSMLEFSGYHKIEDSKFAVHYSLQWIGWSVFDKVATNTGQTIKDYEWKDGYHAALGGTYYLNNDWTLRAGYMYDTAAQDQLTSISVPDSDRHWFSFGAGYNFNKHHTVDLGVTYLMGKDVSVSETNPLAPDLTATTRANAWLAGIQYSYSF